MAKNSKPTLSSRRKPSRRTQKKVALGDDEITRGYNDRIIRYRSLGEEVGFILEQAIDKSEIRIHDVSTRVKALDSTTRKIRDKEYDSLDQVSDLLGARIVCLFRRDLDALRNLIEKEFEVDEFDDKSYSNPESFGYMSLHFQCRLRQDCSGPRL